jgi:hypothetical protein
VVVANRDILGEKDGGMSMIEPGRAARPTESRYRISPYAVGGGFLAFCIARGWVVREGSGRGAAWYVTTSGARALERDFGIVVRRSEAV